MRGRDIFGKKNEGQRLFLAKEMRGQKYVKPTSGTGVFGILKIFYCPWVTRILVTVYSSYAWRNAQLRHSFECKSMSVHRISYDYFALDVCCCGIIKRNGMYCYTHLCVYKHVQKGLFYSLVVYGKHRQFTLKQLNNFMTPPKTGKKSVTPQL